MKNCCLAWINNSALPHINKEEGYSELNYCPVCGSALRSTSHKAMEENCCIVGCSQKAKYEIGDKNKPSSESTFVCEEHKNTLSYDWIVNYNIVTPA